MAETRNMLDITPDTRVAELLDTYPGLEPVLVAMAPAFARLSNPVLRRTVARVATLRQAASIGRTPLGKMINELRRAAGCGESAASDREPTRHETSPPAWFLPGSVVRTFDARPLLEAGGHPISTVLQALRSLSIGQCFELITPFLPAPLIDLAEKQGFASWSTQEGDVFRTYFAMPGAGGN